MTYIVCEPAPKSYNYVAVGPVNSITSAVNRASIGPSRAAKNAAGSCPIASGGAAACSGDSANAAMSVVCRGHC